MDYRLFREMIHPSIIDRARIYWAILPHQDFFEIYLTPSRMIIKSHVDFSFLQDVERSYDESKVFIPPGYDHLSAKDLPYNSRLLADFCRCERIVATIITVREHQNYFLFLSLTNDQELLNLWNSYRDGRLFRSVIISSSCLLSLMERIPWPDRESYHLEPDDRIRVVFRAITRDDYERIVNDLRGEEIGFFRVPWIIQDLHEAYGLLQFFTGDLFPLVGTDRVYFRGKFQITLRSLTEIPTEGVEVISQEAFSEMTFFRKASLIQGRGGHWYSALDLVRLKKDPMTREDLIGYKLTGPEIFLKGFPYTTETPELICTQNLRAKCTGSQNEEEVVFWITYQNRREEIWRVPMLNNTGDAINTIVHLWSMGKLFRMPCHYQDLVLMLTPGVIYLFEQPIQTAEELGKILEKLVCMD